MANANQGADIPRLDEEKFNELKEILGDDIRDIIREFAEIVPGSLEKIASSLKSGDTNQVFVETHTLKSSSGNLGLSRFSQLCAILEAQSRNNEMIDPESQLDILTTEFTASIEAFNNVL